MSPKTPGEGWAQPSKLPERKRGWIEPSGSLKVNQMGKTFSRRKVISHRHQKPGGLQWAERSGESPGPAPLARMLQVAGQRNRSLPGSRDLQGNPEPEQGPPQSCSVWRWGTRPGSAVGAWRFPGSQSSGNHVKSWQSPWVWWSWIGSCVPLGCVPDVLGTLPTSSQNFKLGLKYVPWRKEIWAENRIINYRNISCSWLLCVHTVNHFQCLISPNPKITLWRLYYFLPSYYRWGHRISARLNYFPRITLPRAGKRCQLIHLIIHSFIPQMLNE